MTCRCETLAIPIERLADRTWTPWRNVFQNKDTLEDCLPELGHPGGAVGQNKDILEVVYCLPELGHHAGLSVRTGIPWGTVFQNLETQ